MLDRVAADGSFPDWDPALGLDVAYPLGGFLTHFLLRGDPRKIVLARHDVQVASGQHRAPGHRPVNAIPVCVHHFKWRSGVVAYLSKRVAMLGPGRPWREMSPAVRLETHRVLDHLAVHHGRVDVTDPAWGFAPATTSRLPSGWEAKARRIIDTWRPPTTPATTDALR